MRAVPISPVTLRVLGNVELDVNGTSVPVGRRRERIVLALLALRAPVPVPVDQLRSLLSVIGELNGDARLAVQVCMSRLRGVIAPHGATIVFANHAYRLRPGTMNIDAAMFRCLVAGSAAATDLVAQLTGLRQALALWRGDALGELNHPQMRASLTAELVESPAPRDAPVPRFGSDARKPA